MCGIFGFSGRNGQRANLLKLKLLGAYNTERGKDSCGYYYNGNVVKGTNIGDDKQADFKEFIVINGFNPGDIDEEIFMGHTRKGPYGTHTLDNAHPFQVNTLTLTHNGTISNIRDLAKEVGITEYFNVDTKGLAKIISLHGYGVLDKYIGYAALAMTWDSDPNSVYLYSGSSKEAIDDECEWIERPLFTLQQPEGLYYSSMESSLKAISSDGSVPISLDNNVVFRIRNGEFTSWRHEVNREFMNVKEKKIHTGSYIMNNNYNDLIRNDIYPANLIKPGYVYCKYARYYSDYKLLDGIYQIDSQGKLLSDNNSNIRDNNTYYFIRGIMIANLYQYGKARELVLSDRFNIADLLSDYAKYPTFCLITEGMNAQEKFRNKWYVNGRMVSNKQSFTPKFSNKKYFIENGVTEKIEDNFT